MEFSYLMISSSDWEIQLMSGLVCCKGPTISARKKKKLKMY